MQGVDCRNAQGICDQATATGSATRSNRNFLIPCEVNEIPDNEEIVDKPHFLDNREFMVESIEEFLFSWVARMLQVAHAIEFFCALDG